MERSGAVHRCVLWMGFLGLCSGCCVSLFGGDGVSLDLGSEEGRPQHCFSAFEVIRLAGCAQCAFLERFVVQEYKYVLFCDQLLLTTAFRQALSWFLAYIYSPWKFSVGRSSPPWVPAVSWTCFSVFQNTAEPLSEPLSWEVSTCLLPMFL